VGDIIKGFRPPFLQTDESCGEQISQCIDLTADNAVGMSRDEVSGR